MEPTNHQKSIFKPYEVKCQETFAWYPGRIIDLVETEGEEKRLRVGFDNDWKEPVEVSLDDVRPAAPPRNLSEWEPADLEKAEAQAKAEQSEPYGWWPCVIQTSKDGYYLINFDGWGELHNEILSKEMLRPRNKSRPLTIYKRSIGKKKVTVPAKLRDWASTEPEELFLYLRQIKQIILCKFISEEGVVLILGDKTILPKAEKLLANTLGHKLDLFALEAQTRQKQDELAKEKEKFSDAVKEEFDIQPDLIKYVYGRKRSNVKKAQEIPGILKVKIDDKQKPAKCTIYAKAGCEDAAQQARDTLEIFIKYMPVPEDCMGPIIGQRGQSIKKIEDDSGVMYIRSWAKYCSSNKRDINDLPPDDPEDKALLADIGNGAKQYLVIIGTASAVNVAKFMIRQKITYKRRQQNIYRHKTDLERELSEYRNRGSDGYRNGYDYGGRGRGRSRRGGRGRGRGGRGR